MLVQHEPGWRLPRPTALARRYHVSAAQLTAAIDQLTARHVLRRLPDGQLYRASPAEYLITLDGLPGLGSLVDPMGAAIDCAGRYTTHRRIPEEIGQVLGVAPGEKATAIRCIWTANRSNAALSTVYLPSQPGTEPSTDQAPALSLNDVLNTGPPTMLAAGLRPAALCLEVQLPAPSVARILRLAPGEFAITVTVSLTAPGTRTPAAVTAAVFRPDLFRIVIASPTATNGIPGCQPEGSAP